MRNRIVFTLDDRLRNLVSHALGCLLIGTPKALGLPSEAWQRAQVTRREGEDEMTALRRGFWVSQLKRSYASLWMAISIPLAVVALAVASMSISTINAPMELQAIKASASSESTETLWPRTLWTLASWAGGTKNNMAQMFTASVLKSSPSLDAKTIDDIESAWRQIYESKNWPQETRDRFIADLRRVANELRTVAGVATR